MRLFGRGKPAKGGGEIGYHNLSDWWLTAFSETEREYIETKYQPMSTGPTDRRPLTQGHIEYSSKSAGQLLWALAGWFKGPTDRYIARQLLDKAEEVSQENVLDLHFTYSGMIKVYYRDRDQDPGALEMAIRACEKQIELAPRAAAAFRQESYSRGDLPAHNGFKQLAIIREKAGEFDEAVRLSTAAKEMRWAGDWDKRIERCLRKLSKKGG